MNSCSLQAFLLLVSLIYSSRYLKLILVLRALIAATPVLKAAIRSLLK